MGHRDKTDFNWIMFAVAFAIALVSVVTSCQKSAMDPVAIEANDMCSFCRMTISEERYAAELIDNDGEALKFDDIGCMVNFVQQKNSSAASRVVFVMDFDQLEWIRGETAFYVRSSEFKTPMNSGIVAFEDQSSAEAAAAKYQGTILRFVEVMK